MMSDQIPPELRPYWLSGSCPSWCIAAHAEMEYESPALWQHWSDWLVELELSAMQPRCQAVDGAVEYLPWTAVVQVEQGVREVGPRVVLIEQGAGETKISFTPEEAETLVRAFVDAIRVARGDGGES